MSDTDLDLLARYAQHRAEDAFAEIVRRHVDLVHSAALRQVRSQQLAEEVAQSTFISLAQNVHRLAPDTILTAWLYQVTRREAIDVVRREARRQLREQIATEMNAMNATAADWTHIEPLLDEAMHALDETDRTAVLLRYFENKSLREVGASLGASENAAQKRLSRAVECLRDFFAKRGLTSGASGLVAVLSANAVQAAPAGLTASISTAAALAGSAFTTTVATNTNLVTMNWINVKSIAAVVASALVAGGGTYLIQEERATRLRSERQELLAQQGKLAGERDAALSATQARVDEVGALRKDQAELLRLRNEVGMLRKQTNALAKLRQENTQLLAVLNATAKANQEPEPRLDLDKQRMRLAKILTLPLLMYTSDHQGMFPASFDLASAHFQEAYQADPFLRDVTEFLEATRQFEIVYHGSRDVVANANSAILIREKEARQRQDGQWERAYGFVDGHGETRVQSDNNFEDWEKKRSTVPTSGRLGTAVDKAQVTLDKK